MYVIVPLAVPGVKFDRQIRYVVIPDRRVRTPVLNTWLAHSIYFQVSSTNTHVSVYSGTYKVPLRGGMLRVDISGAS